MEEILPHGGPQPGLHHRCFPSPSVQSISVCFPPGSSLSRDTQEAEKRQININPPATGMALDLHHLSIWSLITFPLVEDLLPLSEPGQVSSSQPPVSPLHNMDDLWLNSNEKSCFQDIQTILMNSRKYSTTATYTAKRKRFLIWAQSQHLLLHHPEVRHAGLSVAPDIIRPFD